jgi:hypothetical protein
MGRFARNSEHGVINRNQVKMTGPLPFAGEARLNQRERQTSADRNRQNDHAPVELKFFVLALAALVGLGIGWLSGKAITGWLPAANPPLAAAERTAPAIPEEANENLQAAQPSGSQEGAAPQEVDPDAAASPDMNAPDAALAQVAPDDTQTRAGRRVARRTYMRRHARGNVFFRPFKALRKLRIW